MSRTSVHPTYALLSIALAGVLAAGAARGAERFDPSRSEPAAVALADGVIEKMGGEKAWEKLHCLAFTFQVSVNDTVRAARRHWWDKWTGWHRVEGKTGAGVPFCFVSNINTREGKAWMGGNPIEGDSLTKLLQRAYAMWVNDTYWLNMPFKLKDPGVMLKLDGEHRDGGQVWDKLALSFENVGLTPGDHYWLFVNRATGMIDRWEMVLQGDQPPPVGYDWTDWREVGGVRLSARRTHDGRAIEFPVLAAPASFPEHTFKTNQPMD
jgi:hypothetical protein